MFDGRQPESSLSGQPFPGNDSPDLTSEGSLAHHTRSLFPALDTVASATVAPHSIYWWYLT